MQIDKVIKIGGMVCTVAGALLSMISSEKEKSKMIEEAVEKHLNKENK